ncbi:uncharacterized protein EI90DRAFT_3028371 [Cantharellus anzutake]|uniref:uncharacterized protein n=1 Tax=Cantharellus anzutake TaxID=1750568 RepID=UPI0019056051|nr:uncharacterized protein EI90DRAFT_3028371 [Cantharellus anzutake]KAF8344131.1 hypothetical protein EI90DRAFT_3028371 [Cantharellus anzutake]
MPPAVLKMGRKEKGKNGKSSGALSSEFVSDDDVVEEPRSSNKPGPSTNTDMKDMKKERKRKSKSQADVASSQPPEDERVQKGLMDSNYTVIRGALPEVDWDVIGSNPNIELIAVRVPRGLDPKQLDGMHIPFSMANKSSGKTLSFTTKDVQYELTQVKEDSGVGADEMKHLACLLPRKVKGDQLYTAPKPLSRHFIIRQVPDALSPMSAEGNSVSPSIQASEKPVQPTELLKHQFYPIGSLAPVRKLDGGSPPVEDSPHKSKKKRKHKHEEEGQSSSPPKPKSKRKHRKSID